MADSGTDRWEFLVCMKAAPITDHKAERPENFGLYQKFDPVFLESAEPRPRHSVPPPPRSKGSSLTSQSHRSEFRIPHICP